MYAEAAKTAVIIAQEQQSKGFYKAAHDLLFGGVVESSFFNLFFAFSSEMYKTLREQNIHVPMEMENNLQLLHSYNIIKVFINFRLLSDVRKLNFVLDSFVIIILCSPSFFRDFRG